MRDMPQMANAQGFQNIKLRVPGCFGKLLDNALSVLRFMQTMQE
jgi:hypothetical protein